MLVIFLLNLLAFVFYISYNKKTSLLFIAKRKKDNLFKILVVDIFTGVVKFYDFCWHANCC